MTDGAPITKEPIRLDLFIGGDMGMWLVEETLLCYHREVDSTAHLGLGHLRFNVIGVTDPDILARLEQHPRGRDHFPTTQRDVNAWAAWCKTKPPGDWPRPADIALLVHCPTLVKAETIKHYRRVYNLHPGLLPLGRGMFPVPWAIIDKHSAGATLHVIDSERVDAGPIVERHVVIPGYDDTAESVHARVRDGERRILRAFIDNLRDRGELPREEPIDPIDLGRNRKRADFDARRFVSVDELESLRATDLLRLARAYTFTGYPGLRVGPFELTLKRVP